MLVHDFHTGITSSLTGRCVGGVISSCTVSSLKISTVISVAEMMQAIRSVTRPN